MFRKVEISVTNEKVRVLCIEPDDIPVATFIDNDLLQLDKLVNVDKYGNPIQSLEPFEIIEIKDNINIISSPKAEERSLPLVRKVGKRSKFYGIMYIVKMDSNFNLVSLTSDECLDYRMKFLQDEVSLSDLGLSDPNGEDNGKRRVTITCDDW